VTVLLVIVAIADLGQSEVSGPEVDQRPLSSKTAR
jgi:hypothetical protein